jgi:hypothetical protein
MIAQQSRLGIGIYRSNIELSIRRGLSDAESRIIIRQGFASFRHQHSARLDRYFEGDVPTHFLDRFGFYSD